MIRSWYGMRFPKEYKCLLNFMLRKILMYGIVILLLLVIMVK